MPAPREPDSRLKDWWVENPWLITEKGKSLSGHERNRAFLNDAGRTFFEVSHLTGADSEGDGRSAVAFDFNGDGMQDLAVRQAGGGPFLLFENRWPRQHYLQVTLRGTDSNRQGIGARVTATVAGRQIVRENFPANTFSSQAPATIHLGLGAADSVEKLVITWPNGATQELRDVKGDRHIRITEGSPDLHTLTRRAP